MNYRWLRSYSILKYHIVTTMKKLVFFLFIGSFCLWMPVRANPVLQDSIIVTFGEKTKLTIYGEDERELAELLKYDLNALLKDLEARLDTMKPDSQIYIDELDGSKYLKDKSDRNKDQGHFKIGLRGLRYKKDNIDLKIASRGSHLYLNADQQKEAAAKKDSMEITKGAALSDSADVVKIRKVYTYSSPRKGFFLDLGFNNYGLNRKGEYVGSEYDLRPLGSRYVSLGIVTTLPLVRRRAVGFHLDFGLDFSWYNMMFEGNNTVRKEAEFVSFPVTLDAEGKEVEMKKSKLTVPFVNLSLMPTVSFPKAFVSHISAGVYGGYRLGAYTKTKREDGGKDKVRSDFFLNDYRFGLSAEVGIRHFLDFFINYDLNTVFREHRGPEVRMLSFGIRL